MRLMTGCLALLNQLHLGHQARLLLNNESQSSRVFKVAEDLYNKSARSVGKKEVGRVDEVMSELNDNPVYFERAEPFSVSEFREYYENKFKSYPSPKVTQYYHDQLRLNDTAWVLRADSILKRAIETAKLCIKLMENSSEVSRLKN